MKNLTTKYKVLDKFGNPVATNSSIKKKAFGQFSSIYEYPNYGRFRSRFYVNQDSELGASYLTRDLCVRWSRELNAQLPWINAAIRTLAFFAVGNAYKPDYKGANKDWWKNYAEPYLLNDFYPNCCKRGTTFDFQTAMFVESLMLDQDGDFLTIYGKDGQFQIIPCHRVGSMINGTGRQPFIQNPATDAPMEGPIPNTIISDGVVYNGAGTPLGYNVINPDNMVNSLLGNNSNMFFSSRDSQLIYDPRFFDRGRGFPSISSGILQGLSLQEIESYQLERIKIQSMIALVEKTPSGEGGFDEAQAWENMMAEDSAINGLAPTVSSAGTQGLRIVDGPDLKYVNASGGDIKALAVDSATQETNNYITRLEMHVLQTIGVPHMILFSPEKVSGRMSDGVCKTFNAAITQRQKILDKHAKFILSWALAKAMDDGIIPEIDEILYNVIDLTHPPIFTLNDSYDRKDDLEYFKSGLKPMNDITVKRCGKTAEQIMQEIHDEQLLFVNHAKDIADKTGIDLQTSISLMREQVSNAINDDKQESTNDSNEEKEKEENESNKNN